MKKENLTYEIVGFYRMLSLNVDGEQYEFENIYLVNGTYNNTLVCQLYVTSSGNVIVSDKKTDVYDSENNIIEFTIKKNIASDENYMRSLSKYNNWSPTAEFQNRINSMALTYIEQIDELEEYFKLIPEQFKAIQTGIVDSNGYGIKEIWNSEDTENDTYLGERKSTQTKKEKSELEESKNSEREAKRQERKKKAEENADKAADNVRKTIKISLLCLGWATKTIGETTQMVDTTIANIKSFIETITKESIAFGTEIATTIITKNPYVQWLILKLRKFMIRAEILLKKFQRWIDEKVVLNMLQRMYEGKCTGALITAYEAVMKALQKVGTAIDAASKYITYITQSIIQFFTVIQSEGLCFFPTPKTMGQTVPMPIVNLRKSVGDILDATTKKIIDSLKTSDKAARLTTKAAFVSMTVAASQVAKQVVVPEFMQSAIQITSKMSLTEAASKVIELIPVAKPLPKYEKLVPWNVGWMIFLVSGWCKAGQVAFGWPGYFPGIMTQEAEVKDYGEELGDL